MEVKQKLEIPSLAVVLSIDRSGSMAMTTDSKVTKLDIAKEAAHLVVDLLDERNEVGIMSWDTEFIWDSAVRPARDKQTVHQAISTIKAGGGTDGYPALKESYQVLFERPALLKHVIFLSDGQMTRGDFSGLVRRMAKDKITVSSVAIGKDADAQLMFDIAKWGRGRFYYTEDDTTIPRIFTLETQLASKASLVEQPFKAAVGSPAHEAIQDIDWKNAPPLGGYVATSAQGHRRHGPASPIRRIRCSRPGVTASGAPRRSRRTPRRSGRCSGCAGAGSTSSGPSSRAGRCARDTQRHRGHGAAER